MKLNEIIRNVRSFRGITQLELANALNKSKNVISNWERGYNSPNPDEIETLCKLLRITPNQMFGWDPIPELDDYNRKMRILEEKRAGLRDQQEKLMIQMAMLENEIANARSQASEGNDEITE